MLCWGPTFGTQQALVLLDEWAPATRKLDPDEAWGEFLLRYLHGHGPATIADFLWWTKGTVAGAKTGRAVLGDAVTSVTVEGTTYLVTAELAERAASIPASRRDREAVHLLPAFDEYLLGYQGRRAVLDDEHFQQIVPGGNGVFQPTVIARGRVVGTWRRPGADGQVEIRHFLPLTASQERAAAHAVARYRRYAG